MTKPKVLFICIHNSARSQMAEAFLNEMCGAEFEAESAGLEPGQLNPVVVEAMQEVGIDISQKATKSVEDVLGSGKSFAYVISVCDDSNGERCPTIPREATQLHWSIRDPSVYQGSHAYKLSRTREIRDQIRKKIEEWCGKVCSCAPDKC